MADNTNVNNNAAVVVVGRTAPVPPGQQTVSYTHLRAHETS